MKKLFNNRFLFIVGLSLIVLIGLGIGAYYLFDDADDAFVKSGYVLNPLSSKVEKYYFDENTSYRENLSSMIEFKDVDQKDTKILKDSFLHYLDGSLSFLKNGAILDLNSIDGGEAVKFYNITNESVIEKDGNKYTIKSNGGNVELKNFIGRISDNKYIVVGDLSAKLVGNDTRIDGDYFEIVYVEEGIVNIENNNVKYQVTADGTKIYVGNDIVVDLGDKKISSDGKDIMSMTAITIDGNENIEIIPTEKDEDEDNNGDNTGENGTDGQGGNGESGTAGNGNGEDGTGNSNAVVEKTEEIIVSLKEAAVRSTGISVVFDIYNNKIDDNFTLKVTNLDSGRTVDMFTGVVAEQEIAVNLLSPDTKYLFTVINERDGGKYFQKIFETSDFGIRLERSYATDSELGYRITVDEGTDITNAKLTLYRFNEETKQNEVVTTGYYDSEKDEIKTVEKVTYLSSLKGNIEGVHEVVYDGLDSNTIYTAVLDEFSLASSNFKDIYNITLTSLTLKETPTFSNMTVDKSVSSGSFKLSIGSIEDPDSAITGYTYLIYEKSNPSETVIDPITKSNASPIEVTIGDGVNQLKNDTNYFYKVIIEYYDNEKYIEYVTTDSINFIMGSDPYVTVVPDDTRISYDSIAAMIYLTDNSCLISMPGREKCEGPSSTVIDVSRINSLTGEKTSVFTKLVDFTVDENEVKYDLLLDGLQEGTTYSIEVRADLNSDDDPTKVVIANTDESRMNITTKSLTSFINEWTDVGSNASHVINATAKFIADDGTGTLSPEESASAIKKVVAKLYAGSHIDNFGELEPIATKNFYNNETFNIKEKFYDDAYPITSDETFGLDLEGLKELSDDGKLSEYYTVVLEAYFDEQENNQVNLQNNTIAYAVNPLLLVDNIKDPVIAVNEITKSTAVASGLETNLTNDGTHVGYKVAVGNIDREGMALNKITPQDINLYVYNERGKKVKFYVMDESKKLVLVDKITDSLGDSDYYESKIYMDYGTEYSVVDDDIMRRGNKYYVGYEINVISSSNDASTGEETTSSYVYPTNKDGIGPSENGIYKAVEPEKETPSVKMYISKSTEDKITYNYQIIDSDNALYRESTDDDYGFYYTIGESSEKKLSINKNEDGTYSGSMTISGLKNNDLYSLYYKKNNMKTGVFENDVLNYLDGDDTGRRIFDGYYDVTADGDPYNFKYEIINNNNNDNKVVIKVLADKEIIDRILSYKVTFTDGSEEVVKEEWKLSSCSDITTQAEEDDVNRCFAVDYNDLKKMKTKSITVKVEALYDNGLTGYDYDVWTGSKNDISYEYQYMILQNNLVEDGSANYIAFSSSGTLIAWNETLNVGKGYYVYSKSGRLISYQSKYNTRHSANISYNLTSLGYSTNLGTLNPKMVSSATMSAQGQNTFSFNSIVPKIKVDVKSQLINGGVVNLTLSGADLEDFENEDDNYYLYIDTWNNENYALSGSSDGRQRPTLKVKIDKDNSSKTVEAVIDGLASDKTYYFNVYAKLKKENGYELTQLNDVKYTDSYKTQTYTFKSVSGQSLFSSLNVAYSANDSVYGNRDLDTTIKLKPYLNSYPYNFDIFYVFCDAGSDKRCGINTDNEEDNILNGTIANGDVSKNIVVKDDISDKDLEFGKKVGYYMYVYAVADYYNSSTKEENLTKNNILLNVFDIGVTLKSLTEPDFVVERNAVIVDGKYAIDFNVNVKDPDRTLIDGEYYVKLLDEDGNVAGTLQVLDDENNYIAVSDYTNYGFDAFVLNKNIRITDLSPNTKYTIVVSGDAYINNYSETVPKEQRTYEIKKSHTVYSVNTYGVAFGNDILFSATEKSIVATFLGGSNFTNVTEVSYTVGLWDNDQNTNTISGTYIIGENNKKFEMFKDTEDWRFVIDPAGMSNVLGQTYTVTLSFKVKVPGTDPIEYVTLTSADNSSFAGKVQYVEDSTKQ